MVRSPGFPKSGIGKSFCILVLDNVREGPNVLKIIFKFSRSRSLISAINVRDNDCLFLKFSEGQVATLVKPQTTRREIGEQLKQDITEFYARFRQKYLALRRKHIKELKELRKLSKNNNCTGKQFRRSYNWYGV